MQQIQNHLQIVWLVAHRDWLETIRSKIFWVGTIVPMLIGLLAVVIPLITMLALALSTPDSQSNAIPQQQQLQDGYVAISDLEWRSDATEANLLSSDEEFIANLHSIISGGLRFVLLISVVLTSGFLAKNTLEEKSSKVADMLFSSLTPHQLMDGKILGTFLIVLTMVGTWMSPFILLWIVSFIPVVIFNAEIPATSELGQTFSLATLLNPFNLLNFLIFFVFGLFLYANLMSALGSLCTKVEEARFMTVPLNLIAFAGFLSPFFVSDNVIASAIAIFPLSTPFSMLTLVAELPPWPLYLLVCSWMVTSAIGLRWFAAKIFTKGVLGESTSSRRIPLNRERKKSDADNAEIVPEYPGTHPIGEPAELLQLKILAPRKGLSGRVYIRWLIAVRDWADVMKSKLFWSSVVLVPLLLILCVSIVYFPQLVPNDQPTEDPYHETEVNVVERDEYSASDTGILPTNQEDDRFEDRVETRYVAAVLLMFLVFSLGIYLASTNSTEEKATKLGELLISVVDPRDLLDGKLIGTFLVILTFVAFCILVLAIPVMLHPSFTEIFLQYALLGYFEPIFVVNFVLFVGLGFAFYGYLSSACGAFCTTFKEAQSMATPISICLGIAFLLQVFQSKALISIVSYIPPFTPLAMIRGVDELPNWPSYLVIVVLMVLAVVASRHLAVALYAKGLLLEKRPSGLKQVVKLASSSI